MPVKVSAPGRICLFGEHQDFLGLAVIATPIDLDISITATPRDDDLFVLHMPDLTARGEADRDSFRAHDELPYLKERDYIRSATNILRRAGLRIRRGYECTIRGTIPINAGTSSSSALTIAWITFLLNTQEGDVPRRSEDIAHFGYEAEVKEFGEPGGMMDHYTSAVGGLLHIDCQEPITVTPLAAELDGFVLGDTLVPKNTTGVLGESRRATNAGVEILREKIPGFDFRTTPISEAEKCFGLMEPEIQRRVVANFVNRDLCREALKLLSVREVDSSRLGTMLYEHQCQLRDGIGVSHPKLDELVEAAMEAGALGAKLNGSGCGGAMFAYAPGKQEQVAEAIRQHGGRAYIVKTRGGVTCEVCT